MEDRALSLRGRHFHGAFVIQATAVVINNAALYGSKYNLGCPYRAMTIMRNNKHVDLGMVLSKCIIMFY